MSDKRLRKIKYLLALANDAEDEESMTALAKAQELMVTYGISEDDVVDYKQCNNGNAVLDKVIHSGRPQKWLYILAEILAKNFRVKFYYNSGMPISFHYIGIDYDIQVAEITFLYAKGSVSYLSKKYIQRPEVKRKRKRKWRMKKDYIQGYLTGLAQIFEQQVIANGYEVALLLPDVVKVEIDKLDFEKAEDFSYEVQDREAFYFGYQEGIEFQQRELIGE